MTGPDPLADVRILAARWRADLRRRSEEHRSSDALTEPAWADRALADIERVASGRAADNGPDATTITDEQDPLFRGGCLMSADRRTPDRVLGYVVVAQDLGDGRVELWEGRADGTAPLRATSLQCREEMARLGASPEVWHVVALVDLDGER